MIDTTFPWSAIHYDSGRTYYKMTTSNQTFEGVEFIIRISIKVFLSSNFFLSTVKQTILVQFFTGDFQIYKKGYLQPSKIFIYTP